MHLKPAQTVVFIQERIVFLADLSPASSWQRINWDLSKTKWWLQFLTDLLLYIFIQGRRALPQGCLLLPVGRHQGGWVYFFFFICSLWFDLYGKRDIFIIVHSKLGFFIAHESCFPKLDYLYSTLIAMYFWSWCLTVRNKNKNCRKSDFFKKTCDLSWNKMKLFLEMVMWHSAAPRKSSWFGD